MMRDGVRYSKHQWRDFDASQDSLRLAPNKCEYTEPIWLAFDPEHGKGKSPDSLWGQSNLAASEVLSALIQFPEWPLTWLNGTSSPHLSGYQVKYNGDWKEVPIINGQANQLFLGISEASYAERRYASPSVREC